jgi:putative holliday junction resolvase
MRYLGIDYGSKNIGLSLSDEAGQFAFAYSILKNNQEVVLEIKQICDKEGVGAIVLGESKNRDGSENLVMTEIRTFGHALSEVTSLPIFYEPEFYTTREAEQIIGKDVALDARAAAIILKSYLDKQKFSK